MGNLQDNAPNAALQNALDDMYGEMKRLAHGQLSRERADHTLSATALVHEAYLKLAANHPVWQDRNHFLALAARAMRQTLITYALAHRTEKRGGDMLKLTLTYAEPEIDAKQQTQEAEDVLNLDEALKSLETVDPRQGKIVELRYFAGLSIEDTAEAMSLSPATVKREWALARLYLKRAMQQ